MNIKACVPDIIAGYDSCRPVDRREYLLNVKKASPTLHALSLMELDRRRQSVALKQSDFAGRWDEASGPMKKAAELLPSPYRLKLEISDQMFEYDRNDLRKIAMDIRNGHEGAAEAFHFIYSNIFPAGGKIWA